MNRKKYMNRLKHLCSLLIFIFICFHQLCAQTDAIANTSVSTNAQSATNVNMDLFRGQAYISIPVYKFNSKHIEVPISLNYNPVNISGNQDNLYHPSNVGLGWSLSAGGVITRSVNDFPDEKNELGNFFNSYTKEEMEKDRSLEDLIEGEDEFSFNFLGHTGTFIFNGRKWIAFSNENLIISKTIDIDQYGNNYLSQFQIATNDGYIYYFGGAGATEFSNNSSDRFTSAWYLVKIVSPENDIIDFQYTQNTYNEKYPITKQCILSSEKAIVTGADADNDLTYTHLGFEQISKTPSDEEIADLSVYSSIEGLHLSKITSPTSLISIQFNGSNSETLNYRQYGGSTQLFKYDNIELIYNNSVYKRYNLNFDISATSPFLLTSFQETAISATGSVQSLPGYLMSYYPSTHSITPYVLNQLRYPEGFTSTFEFENNTFSDAVSETYYNKENSMTGYLKGLIGIPQANTNVLSYSLPMIDTKSGFRIKSIVRNDAISGRIARQDFYYTISNPFGSAANLSSGIKNRSGIFQRYDIAKSLASGIYVMKKETGYDCSYRSEWGNSTVQESCVGYSWVWEVNSLYENNSLISRTASKYHYTNYADKENVTYTDLNGVTKKTIIWDYKNVNEVGKLLMDTKYNFPQNSTTPIECGGADYEYGGSDTIEVTRYLKKYASFKYIDGKVYSTKETHSYQLKHFSYNVIKSLETKNGFTLTTTYKYDKVNGNVIERNVIEPKFNYNRISPDETLEFNGLNGSKLTTSYQYATGLTPSTYEISNLPVETVTKRDGKVIMAIYNEYKKMSDCMGVRPYKVYELELTDPITDFQPYDKSTNKFDNRYKLKTTYDLYDGYGNLLQAHNENGVYTAYYYLDIYSGTGNTKYSQPTVVAQNCTYADLESAINSIGVSGFENICKLIVRLPLARISTTFYDYRFGKTEAISPNAIQSFVEYDAFGRPAIIRDNNQSIINKYEYFDNVQ